MRYLCFLSVCAFGIASCIEHDFKGFDDTILFGINWPGNPETLENLVEGDVNKPQVIKKKLLLTAFLFKNKNKEM